MECSKARLVITNEIITMNFVVLLSTDSSLCTSFTVAVTMLNVYMNIISYSCPVVNLYPHYLLACINQLLRCSNHPHDIIIIIIADRLVALLL